MRMMGKSVKVHDDTHRALKLLKARRRSQSIDQVIREIIKSATGSSVEPIKPDDNAEELTKYLKE